MEGKEKTTLWQHIQQMSEKEFAQWFMVDWGTRGDGGPQYWYSKFVSGNFGTEKEAVEAAVEVLRQEYVER